jgi:hypothetical protein
MCQPMRWSDGGLARITPSEARYDRRYVPDFDSDLERLLPERPPGPLRAPTTRFRGHNRQPTPSLGLPPRVFRRPPLRLGHREASDVLTRDVAGLGVIHPAVERQALLGDLGGAVGAGQRPWGL